MHMCHTNTLYKEWKKERNSHLLLPMTNLLYDKFTLLFQINKLSYKYLTDLQSLGLSDLVLKSEPDRWYPWMVCTFHPTPSIFLNPPYTSFPSNLPLINKPFTYLISRQLSLRLCLYSKAYISYHHSSTTIPSKRSFHPTYSPDNVTPSQDISGGCLKISSFHELSSTICWCWWSGKVKQATYHLDTFSSHPIQEINCSQAFLCLSYFKFTFMNLWSKGYLISLFTDGRY